MLLNINDYLHNNYTICYNFPFQLAYASEMRDVRILHVADPLDVSLTLLAGHFLIFGILVPRGVWLIFVLICFIAHTTRGPVLS